MRWLTTVTLLLVLLPGIAAAAEPDPPQFGVGDRVPDFTLVSHQDRTVDYVHDYYGRYHLILTFFPAAFTPV